MSNYIDLPTGDSIRADTIFAVRLGDAHPPAAMENFSLKPRVIIDFGLSQERGFGFGRGGHSNSIICDCDTVEERNALARSIRGQL